MLRNICYTDVCTVSMLFIHTNLCCQLIMIGLSGPVLFCNEIIKSKCYGTCFVCDIYKSSFCSSALYIYVNIYLGYFYIHVIMLYLIEKNSGFLLTTYFIFCIFSCKLQDSSSKIIKHKC